MGVGGLLMEIVTRPQPRAKPVEEMVKRVAAVVLAAGRSDSYGCDQQTGRADWRGSRSRSHRGRTSVGIAGWTGNRRHWPSAGEGRGRTQDLNVRFVHNPDYAEGLGTCVARRYRSGVGKAPTGAIVCLGDMPQVDTTLIDTLLNASDPRAARASSSPLIDGHAAVILWYGRGASSRTLCRSAAISVRVI